MLKLNQELLLKKGKELTEFKGWLPFRLESFINLSARRDYLQSVGLYEDIEQANQDYMRILRLHPEPQKLMDDLLIEFVDNNPEFEGIILES